MCKYRDTYKNDYTEVSPNDISILEKHNIVKKESDDRYCFLGTYDGQNLNLIVPVENTNLIKITHKGHDENDSVFDIKLFNVESDEDDDIFEAKGIDELAGIINLIFLG